MNRRDLLKEYGSPAYIYDLAEVRATYTTLRTALPDPCTLYYSLKANPHPALVAQLIKLGCRAEISSRGELAIALQSGGQGSEALYTGPGKTTLEITTAIRSGVTCFSVDSVVDIQRVAAVARQEMTMVRLLLRINPAQEIRGFGLTMTGVPSQFGIDAQQVLHQPDAFADTDWTRLSGFHIYMGTNLFAAPVLLQTFEVASQIIARLIRCLQIQPEIIDLGGGFGYPFAAQGEGIDVTGLRQPLEHLLDQYFVGWRQGYPTIAFESGRYLVAQAGTLYCTVQDVKVSQGQTFVITDSGIHHLGGMSGLRRILSSGVEAQHLTPEISSGQINNAHIVGALCTPMDHWARGVTITQFSPGDIMAIPNVGAYGLTGSLIGFLSRETPVEIVLDGEAIKDVSQLHIERRVRGN